MTGYIESESDESTDDTDSEDPSDSDHADGKHSLTTLFMIRPGNKIVSFLIRKKFKIQQTPFVSITRHFMIFFIFLADGIFLFHDSFNTRPSTRNKTFLFHGQILDMYTVNTDRIHNDSISASFAFSCLFLWTSN